jgi:hypothetical protein
VTLIALLAIGLAAAVYLARRTSCDGDGRALVGEVKRVSDGTLLYFDGRCWTTKPAPPTDTPF